MITWGRNKVDKGLKTGGRTKTGMSGEREFIDIIPSNVEVRNVKETRRHMLIVDATVNGQDMRLIFGRRARSQLTKLGGLDALVKRGDLMLRALVLEDGAYYIVRATTTKYTAVPHRVLFDFVKGVIREATGLDIEPRVVSYKRRTVAYYPVYEVPLNYARPRDMIRISLAVSNANTGQHSIKVYGYAEILACKNGLMLSEVSSVAVMAHRGSVEDVLKRVAEAVKEVLNSLREKYPLVARRIEALQDVPITESVIRNWLKVMREKLGMRYVTWLEAALARNKAEFGNTALTLFQTMTYLIPRVRNEKKVKELNKEVNELLNNPTQYIRTYAPSTN